jgi:hypothetical protein
MNPDDNMASHISKLERLSRKLIQLEEPISDSMLMTKIDDLARKLQTFLPCMDSIPNIDKSLANFSS